MKGEVQLQPPQVMQNPSDSDPLLGNQEEDESPVNYSEIKDEEDIEAGSLPCCRICLESDSEPGESSCKSLQIYADFSHFRLELLSWGIWAIGHFPVKLNKDLVRQIFWRVQLELFKIWTRVLLSALKFVTLWSNTVVLVFSYFPFVNFGLVPEIGSICALVFFVPS